VDAIAIALRRIDPIARDQVRTETVIAHRAVDSTIPTLIFEKSCPRHRTLLL
jgi:hypothetical protein